jgi:hypothetical protein
MFGGDYVIIRKDSKVLLNLYQQRKDNLPKAEKILDEEHDWEKDMNKLMKNADKLIRDYKKEQTNALEKDTEERQKRLDEKRKMDELWKKAEDMGLIGHV